MTSHSIETAPVVRKCIARRWLLALLAPIALVLAQPASADTAVPSNYQLASGDAIRVVVFQNPDLTLETRVSEDTTITYPLIGNIRIGDIDIGAAERKIAKALSDGGFVKNPQVHIQLLEVRGNKVAVLGQVNKPGSFPLLTTRTHMSEILAEAGGITPIGDDRVIVTGTRGGTPFRREIDVDSLYKNDRAEDDLIVAGGDSVYVPRAPMFFIYGEILKPGSYRVEHNMTMRQALASGGGLTLRGTERRLRVVRPNAQGVPEKIAVDLEDPVAPGDVIYVNESIF